jgi:hypothetical protein
MSAEATNPKSPFYDPNAAYHIEQRRLAAVRDELFEEHGEIAAHVGETVAGQVVEDQVVDDRPLSPDEVAQRAAQVREHLPPRTHVPETDLRPFWANHDRSKS